MLYFIVVSLSTTRKVDLAQKKKCKGSWICIGPYIAPHFEKLAYEGQVTLTIPAFTS